jgi:hypothetical protein
MRVFTPALDIGSHLNARTERRPTGDKLSEAYIKPTLEAVSSEPLLGHGSVCGRVRGKVKN